MPVLVMKFGGTSVATLDRIRRASKRVGLEVAKGYDVIVIVSAMAGKTNELPHSEPIPTAVSSGSKDPTACAHDAPHTMLQYTWW